MMKSFAPLSFLALSFAAAGDAASIPAKSLTRADFCGQWDTTTTGDFILYNNLWGQDNDPAGTQCTGLDSANGNTIAWHSTWSWAGTSWQVKSYPNAALQFTPRPLSEVNSIRSSWEWSYSTTNIIANVAYDLFLSSTANGSEEYEIMVWLGALGGAGPISSTGSAIATVPINGVSWDLWVGPNGDMTVYSFVAPSSVTSFSGDLLEFLTYLEDKQGLSSSLYLLKVQAGTEPFSGTADFTVSSYSASIA